MANLRNDCQWPIITEQYSGQDLNGWYKLVLTKVKREFYN